MIGLRAASSEFSPDVEHEDGCDEDEGHDKDWNWSDFESSRVFSVETPQSSVVASTSTSWSSGSS